MNFGARVDAGFPFGVHKKHDTGNWIGPLSLIMAQNETLTEPNVVDHYAVRYVETPSTPYLRMDPNCTLFSPDDFPKYMGLTAVRETEHVQAKITHGIDPYKPYLETCDNGDVKPILPLFGYSFVEGDDGEEHIEVTLDYKVLTFPHKTDIMYKVYPSLQKRFNKREGEFHISGPYCYGECLNDYKRIIQRGPNKGFPITQVPIQSGATHSTLATIQGMRMSICSWFMAASKVCTHMSNPIPPFQSSNTGGYLTNTGLPCLPSASEIAPSHGGADSLIHNSTAIKPHTLNVGPILLLSFLVFILSVLLLVSVAFHIFGGRRRNSVAEEEVLPATAESVNDVEGAVAVASVDDTASAELTTPLLDNGNGAPEGKQ